MSHDDADSVLSGLTSAGFVQPGPSPGAANLVLVLTGGAQDGVNAADSAAVYARLAEATREVELELRLDARAPMGNWQRGSS